MIKLFVFGNGNITFNDFQSYYVHNLNPIIIKENVHFLLCDFKGTDTLMMEYLKCLTSNVTIYHIGSKPRYIPDLFKTKVNDWLFMGGFNSDKERDSAAINNCTHYLAFDFNSDKNRKSGTLKNIETCHLFNKIFLPSD
ncbi:MAG: hypothetical protein ACK5IQ_07480 [Bacteroidales bacterium]